MIRSLIAWDASGDVVATVDYSVVYDDDGAALGLVDFEAIEQSGGRLREAVEISNAVGSGTWPEWLGLRAHDFRVELDPSPGPARARIVALQHRGSGHRRTRAEIEGEIERRIEAAREKARQAAENGRRAAIEAARASGVRGAVAQARGASYAVEPEPVDIRDLVGGPGRPVPLDDNGRTTSRPVPVGRRLPLISTT